MTYVEPIYFPSGLMEDEIDFLVMVAIIALYEEYFILKLSYFEVYIDNYIKMN